MWTLFPLAAALVVFGPACLDAQWITDDRHLIAGHMRPGDVLGEWTQSTHAHAADVQGGFLWRPLTSTVYQIWGGLFGRTPLPFRLLSLLTHLTTVWLVTILSRREGCSLRNSALVGAVFALHPVAVDSVCWVSDLYDVSAAAFLLASALVALGGGRVRVRALCGGLLFLFALLSKEAVLPWMLALPLWLWLRLGWRTALVHLITLTCVGVAHKGWHTAIVGSFDRSVLEVLSDAPFVLVWIDYLWWPIGVPVRAMYTHLIEPSSVEISFGGIGVVLVSIGSVVQSLRSRSARTTAVAVGTMVWIIMVGTGAVAAASFLNQPARYLYVPMAVSVPLLAGAAAGVVVGQPLVRQRLVGALVVVWLLAWLPFTVRRTAAWESEASLYAAEYAAEPNNPFAAKELGRILFGAGEVDRGLQLWKQALELPPSSQFVMDPQRERLDLAQAAAAVGKRGVALWSLEAFVEQERVAGRAIDPSVEALRARIEEMKP